MPEIPEVLLFAELCEKTLKNTTITSIKSSSGSKKNEYKKEIDNIINIKIKKFEVKGKKFIINMKNYYIVISFGLKGTVKFEKISEDKDIQINFSNGKSLFYYDPMNFGSFKILKKSSKLFKDTGPTWLVDEITYEDFKDVISRKRLKKMQICSFLTNQKYFSGIGNYMKSDILYKSRIYPGETLGSLTKKQIKKIYEAIIYISETSYNKGGWKKHSLTSQAEYIPLIYEKKDIDGKKVKIEIFKDKRKTYYIPKLQIKNEEENESEEENENEE